MTSSPRVWDPKKAAPAARLFRSDQPLPLTMGGSLPRLELAFETWGHLNERADNALLLFPGLSASSHAASNPEDGRPGWWESMIGPGLALDTRRFFVVCANHLGGCFGSTGPASPNPISGRPFGPDFPFLQLRDLAAAMRLLVKYLAIARVHAVVGSSMGGMLALEYAACFPKEVGQVISISASGRPGPQSIAYRFVQRQVIMNDPRWCKGRYYENAEWPSSSMAIARQIGNISYRSREEWDARFGRARSGGGTSFGPDFQVEAYLHHMGLKLADQFDPNSFLLLSKAMDLFSLGYGFATYEEGVARIRSRCLVIGVRSDLLFPSQDQENLHHCLARTGADSRLVLLDTPSGHDAFLVDVELFTPVVKSFLES